MNNPKHVSNYNKPKFKKAVLLIPCILIFICILFNSLQPVSSFEKVEPQVVVKPTEDNNMAQLIEQIRNKYNLSENNFGFFYYNINDKKYYFYNENTYFTAGSTVKVPICMYYYDKINDNTYTKDSKLLYTKDSYEVGNGTTAATYSVGQSVPISFLLKQSIINSDNTAINILVNNIGKSEYRHTIAKYSDVELPEDFYENNITSPAYSYDVLLHLYDNKDTYNQLIEDMKQSSMGLYLKEHITDYDVAHKYGSYDGYVHDYGIVFTR